MKETCWKLFSYLAIDHKSAQEELNRMAAEGWALDKISSADLARFRRTDRTDLRYFLDWTDATQPEEGDYLQLCAEAGWDLVETVGYLNIYASRPGMNPAPIQTDPALEYQRYRSKVLRRMIASNLPLVIFFSLLILLAGILGTVPSAPEALSDVLSQSNPLSLVLLTAPLLLAAGILRLICSVKFLRLWRRTAEAGEPLPVPEAKAARRRGALNLFSAVYATLMFPFLTADILLNDLSVYAFVGMLLGGIFLMVQRSEERRIVKRGLAICALALFFILCGWAHDPLREAFPGRVPAPPVLEGAILDLPSGDADERTDTFLGSSARWGERFLLYTSGSTTYYTSVYFTVRTWASPFLADRDKQSEQAEAVPLEGYEAVWRLKPFFRDGQSYLLRRGNTWLTLDCTDELAFDPLPAALDWLEGWCV